MGLKGLRVTQSSAAVYMYEQGVWELYACRLESPQSFYLHGKTLSELRGLATALNRFTAGKGNNNKKSGIKNHAVISLPFTAHFLAPIATSGADTGFVKGRG